VNRIVMFVIESKVWPC